MFTGIIEEIGIIKDVKKGSHSAALTISAEVILDSMKPGDSISVNGVCLTAVSFSNTSFCADVMHETQNRSALSSFLTGSPVNLERAMPADGRFGGHIVSGHIDGSGQIRNITKDDNAIWFTIAADKKILRYVVEKGSIAIDGISLTVAQVSKSDFSVSVIPFTFQHTTLSRKKIGSSVNLENDCVGKYIENLLVNTAPKAMITSDYLKKFGF